MIFFVNNTYFINCDKKHKIKPNDNNVVAKTNMR